MNLSPACAERTGFLIEMLDRMADGLLDHIERKFSTLTDDFKGELKNYLISKYKNGELHVSTRNQDWMLIYD